MIKVLRNPSQIITVNTNAKNVKRGKELSQIDVLYDHSIIIENELIKDVLPSSSVKNNSDFQEIDLKDKIVLPGIVECHTHTAFAGSRADEFRKKISGVSYEEIAREGGGINTTVQAVRSTSFEDLIKIISPRIHNFISQGVTTLEIKSGYGLDFENEIKLLNVINFLNKNFPIDIVPTFLGAHTYPSNY